MRTATDLPDPLRLASTFPFVGRTAELELLHALMPTAAGEPRRVALLAGEPGCGKSRLVRELAGALAGRGTLVLYGACDAVVPTPYGPFAEALERLVRLAEEAADPVAELGPGAGELTRLLPDLAARVRGLAAPAVADPDTERHRLHTAVTALLANAGRRQPVLLVLEDCHWADAGTLLLLRHLARTSWGGRVLLLSTFRDTEVDPPRELSETLADLRRSDDVVRMRLDALSAGEIADFVERAAGCEPDAAVAELAAAIHDLTDGNAFLVCELWRALVETATVVVGDGRLALVRPLHELTTPTSVREVVSQRLARLHPRTRDLLELAATIGPEFELGVIRSAAGLDERELLAALEETVASGMVEELPGPRLVCRFTHELVRRAVVDRLSHAHRAELHLRVGEALAAAAPERSLADLAHHFSAAAPLGGSERAIDYNVRAARAASAALAFDEAAARLRTAIALGVDDPRERAETLIELGTADHRAGNAAAAFEAFAAAAAIARELGSGELLARAAVGYEDAGWRPGIVSREASELLEEAIPALGADDSPELRVRLLAALARTLDRQGDRSRGAVVRGNAIELARSLDDRSGLAKVLARSYWARGMSPLEEILAMLSEAKELAEELEDAETRTEAMAWRVPTFVSLCDLDAARREQTALLQMSERTAQPFMHHVAEHYGSAIALCDGRLAEAEAMAERSHEWSRLLTGRDASGTYGIQMFSIRREQGRLAELAPAVRILAGQSEREGLWRPGLVAVLAALGMEREARRELARIAGDGIGHFRASLWTATLAYLADAASMLGDERTAALVYPELEPLAGANVMIGHLVSCYGAADRYLGMLAATLGEHERAADHFEQALALNRRMAMQTWVAHTAYEYARLLQRRERGGDRAQAQALAGEAAALAERIGMRDLLARVRALGATAAHDGRAGLPNGLSPREAQILGLVARGLSNKEIGGTLAISEHTAANHIRSILRKTDCANRTEAASFAHRHGLVVTTI
ncbi:AAA family ATPase [Conexibacter stalactiti]|uniref:AAA family ATPase n=1 Tax=Conexibacter stalactiti TaxID=1940611 RepID=A0ABU4HUR2_9ACTN|nr:AAA family ATPase [Conexibacter stalactiti]MDW5596422.1 AAA family ATPase [Conexibacter stalactiti]MEC5037064.1 AAA family ATPase [Conexibacter stalactiti]